MLKTFCSGAQIFGIFADFCKPKLMLSYPLSLQPEAMLGLARIRLVVVRN